MNAEYLAAAELDISQSRNPKSSKEKKCSQFKGDLWIFGSVFFSFFLVLLSDTGSKSEVKSPVCLRVQFCLSQAAE